LEFRFGCGWVERDGERGEERGIGVVRWEENCFGCGSVVVGYEMEVGE
jgi:hypothetical protein